MFLEQPVVFCQAENVTLMTHKTVEIILSVNLDATRQKQCLLIKILLDRTKLGRNLPIKFFSILIIFVLEQVEYGNWTLFL